MQVIWTARNVVLTPAFKALVERKLARLARVGPPIREARVACVAEKFRRTARLTLRTRRHTYASAATAGDLLTALDAALAALRRQARDDKDRRRARKAGARRTPRRQAAGAPAP